MSPIELIAIAAGALGLGGAGGAWWRRRAQQAHVNQTRTAWVRAGRRVVFGPVGTVSFGTRPRQRYRGTVFGASGLVDGLLVFEGQRSARYDLSVPFAALRHLSLITLPVRVERLSRGRRALAVHYISPDGWRMAPLAGETVAALADVLADASGIPLHDAGERRDDYGPGPAARMLQDVYGEWELVRRGPLYLAPDRLLFNWRDDILLQAIRRLDVYDVEGAAPTTLLRVEHDTSDGTAAVGFGLAGASQWAAAVVQRVDVPLEVHAGRKRKRSD